MEDMDEQRAPDPTPGPSTGTSPRTGTDTDAGPRVTGPQMRDVSRLRRSRDDRYLAGVAGGLGRHFDVDPTVIRVLLVVLTFFGGAGVLVYGAVWLFVPQDGQDRAPVDLHADVLKVVLVVTAAIALMIVFGAPFFNDGWGLGFPLPLIVLGLVLVAVFATRDQRRRTGPPPPPPWGTPVPGASATTNPATYSAPSSATRSPSQEGPAMDTTTSTTTGTEPDTDGSDTAPYPTSPGAGAPPPAWMPPQPPAYVPPPRPRRTGVVLFWPTLALIAIGLGTLGIVDVDGDVPATAYAALAVALTGAMLLLGAFRGRPGGLIALGLVASLALGISALAAEAERSSERDTVRIAPATLPAVQPEYRIGTGSIEVDLTRLPDASVLDGRSVSVAASAGEIVVLVPREIDVNVEATIRYAGEVVVDGQSYGGLGQSVSTTISGAPGADTPTLDLDLHTNVGQITVQQR